MSPARKHNYAREYPDLPSIQSSVIAHRGKVGVRVFIGISVRACYSVCVVLCNLKKLRPLAQPPQHSLVG